MAIDPTKVRISDHFLLSDFVFCHSMAVLGYKNEFLDPKNTKIDEISYLSESILEQILAEKGPISVSYGYISPSLSEKIVKYQDPKKPSYHRWDMGAAVDICVHDHVLGEEGNAPIDLAFEIDCNFEYSRMITYSESPFICIATRLDEKDGTGRRAFYENQYQGKPKVKPKYINYSQNMKLREEAKERHELPCDWQGKGYPTYHGGGIRQAQHVRVGRYAMLLDFLYSTRCVNEGVTNLPPADPERRKVFYRAGRAFSTLLTLSETKRLPIVRAYESPVTFDKGPHNWKDGYIFSVVPPLMASPNDIAEIARGIEGVHSVGVDRVSRTVTVAGR